MVCELYLHKPVKYSKNLGNLIKYEYETEIFISMERNCRILK